jgi:hypothetical protein
MIVAENKEFFNHQKITFAREKNISIKYRPQTVWGEVIVQYIYYV